MSITYLQCSNTPAFSEQVLSWDRPVGSSPVALSTVFPEIQNQNRNHRPSGNIPMCCFTIFRCEAWLGHGIPYQRQHLEHFWQGIQRFSVLRRVALPNTHCLQIIRHREWLGTLRLQDGDVKDILAAHVPFLRGCKKHLRPCQRPLPGRASFAASFDGHDGGSFVATSNQTSSN